MSKAALRELIAYWTEGEEPIGNVFAINDESRCDSRSHARRLAGKINLYGNADRERPYWKHDDSSLCNFGAHFVTSGHDAELERLICERDAAPYTGTKEDAARIEIISARLREIGGKYLLWA